jgi:hypothetical protein
MDILAQRVAQRFLDHKVAEQIVNKEEILKRIEAIPGWQRSNFLVSLHRQAGRSPLSDKQLAVLDKIEREQGGRAPQVPASHADVVFDPRKQWFEPSWAALMVQTFGKKNPITVSDPRGLVAPNHKLQEHIIHQLAGHFYGAAERYAENNADEDDPVRRDQNRDLEGRYLRAAHEMERAKMHVKQNGPLTTLTVTPSYQEVVRKHHLPG